jgi:hypothetical protein
MRQRLLIFAAILFSVLLAPTGAFAQTYLSAATPSLIGAEFVAKGGMKVSVGVILFYIFYLGTIWSFNVVMLRGEATLPPQRALFARHFCRANIFLAAGDTAMFIAFLIAYLFPDAFNTPGGSQKLMQLLLFGVFSTSLTMSVYYLYIGLYLRGKFGGPITSAIFTLILIFFIIRLLVHYNPNNIWFSMMLPPGTPNVSAWIRNIPLFIYGLLGVLSVGWFSWRGQQGDSSENPKIGKAIVLAMVCLIVSFICYAIDVFYSHKIPTSLIWIVYTLKTLAYMGAFFFMWLGEFYYGAKEPRAARQP